MLKILRNTKSTIRPRKGGVEIGNNGGSNGGDNTSHDDKYSP